MEEAAQILEVETFVPLMLQNPQDGHNRLKRVIMIGDHHQVALGGGEKERGGAEWGRSKAEGRGKGRRWEGEERGEVERIPEYHLSVWSCKGQGLVWFCALSAIPMTTLATGQRSMQSCILFLSHCSCRQSSRTSEILQHGAVHVCTLCATGSAHHPVGRPGACQTHPLSALQVSLQDPGGPPTCAELARVSAGQSRDVVRLPAG